MRTIIAIIALPLALFGLHFAAEDVEIILEGDGYLRVEAEYTFIVDGDCARGIPVIYPVPVDSLMGAPDSIVAVFDGDTIIPPPFITDSARVWATTMFALPANDDCKKTWHIGYRQKLTADHARYIVTTLQLWNRAIDVADFTIRYPADFEDIYISYAPDSRESIDGEVLARFHFENWMPTRDFVIEWRER
jgi:hypothetical protein